MTLIRGGERNGRPPWTGVLVINRSPVYEHELLGERVRYADMVFYNGTVLTMDRVDTNLSVKKVTVKQMGGPVRRFPTYSN